MNNTITVDLPKKLAALECAYPDAAAAAARCPKFKGCLKNPAAAAAVAAVTLLRPADPVATVPVAETASDDLDGASMLSMVKREEPTADDVLGTETGATTAVAVACPWASASVQSHGSCRGDTGRPPAPRSSTAVTAVIAAVGGRFGRSPLSPSFAVAP